MYLAYYGLLKEPFHITPDPDFLYMSPSHREAFAALVYGVEQRKGFIAMTGEVGAGKTTILRAFMKRVDEKAVKPVYLFNPALTFQELLMMTLRGLGATPDTAHSAAELLDQLHWALVEEYRAGHNVVLLVDEAQNMPVETLEQLRMLSNLETANDKLLQIVLVGQPELEDKLNLHELRQLKQRCAVRSVVKPLGRDESVEYVKHRLHMAGCPRDEVFSASAMRLVVNHAKGSPRTLNILCDNAMIAGFGSQQEVISAAIVRSVIRDMAATSRAKPSGLPRWAWAAGIAAGGIVVGALVSQVGLLGGSASTSDGVLAVATPATAPVAAPVPEAAAAAVSPAPAPVKPDVVASLSAELAAQAADKRNDTASDTPQKSAQPAEAAAPSPALEIVAARQVPEPQGESKPTREPSPVSEVPSPGKSAPAAPAQAPAVVERAPATPTAAEAAAPAAVAESSNSTDRAAEPQVSAPEETPVSAPVAVIAKAEPAASVPVPVEPMPELDGGAAPAPAPQEKTVEVPEADTPTAAPAPAPIAPAPALAAENVLQERTVVQGDCLSRLAAEVYGSGDPQIVRALHRYNAHIENPDRILPGQTVVFPAAELVGASRVETRTAAATAVEAGAVPAGGANP